MAREHRIAEATRETLLEIRYRRHTVGMHLAALADRDVLADDEALIRKMIADVVGQARFVIIMEAPAAAWPVNEMTVRVLLVRALAHHPADIAMLPPEFCIDAILGIERRHDDIGHLGIALGMTGFAGECDTHLPELRRQGGVQDRLWLGL